MEKSTGMNSSPVTVYTVGHSNLSSEQLLTLLQHHGIEIIVDIRAYPGSKRFPQFHQEALRSSVETSGRVYHWAGRQLGGMRKLLGVSRHKALQSESFQAFADYMETDAFQKAVVQLINMAAQEKVALLCAERSAQNCHRSLISDYLVLKGVRVLHIEDTNAPQEHQLSPFARRESQQLIYDRAVTDQLDF